MSRLLPKLRMDRPRRHIRHTLLNLTGIAVPFAIGLLVMPVLVRTLGPAKFGLLGLSWAVLEYFTLFDAGLGRATTRAVAGRLAASADAELSELISASLLVQLALGFAGGIVLAALAPALVHGVLRVPSEHAEVATLALRVLALMLPFVLLLLAVRGVLEAAERFDLSNALRAPASTATFLVPALAASAGYDIPGMLGWLLVARVAVGAAGVVLLPHAIPSFHWRWPPSWRPLRPLLVFGGWVAVSNVLSPLLLLFDRFALGAIAGLAAVGHYTAPYEAATRLLVVPAALVGAVFPAASTYAARQERVELGALYATTLRLLLAALLGVAIVTVLLAPAILATWLGAEAAEHGSTAFRILLVAVLLNALVHVPFAFVQALGRADVTARYHLAELVVHVPVTLVLVTRYGVAGAAGAWAVRIAVDAALVFALARRLVGVGALAALRRPSAWLLAAAVAAAPVALAQRTAADDPSLAAAFLIVAACLYVAVVWARVLTATERGAVLALRHRRSPAPRS